MAKGILVLSTIVMCGCVLSLNPHNLYSGSFRVLVVAMVAAGCAAYKIFLDERREENRKRR